MDETRFASTNVLKALHDDRVKQDLGAMADKTLKPAPVPAPAIPAPPRSNTTMIGIAAAVVVAAAIGVYVMMQPAAPGDGSVREADQARVGGSAPGQGAQPAAPTSSAPAPSATAPATPAAKGTTEKPASTAVEKPAAPVASKKAPPVPVPAATDGAEAAPPPKKTVAATVAVVLTAPYPFEVRDGSRVISAAATSHELPLQPNGRTLRLVAEDVFLDQPVRIDGGAENRFEYSPPGLVRIEIRAAREDCRASIAKRDLGFPPYAPVPAVAGTHQVSLVCPDGQNPINQTTVVPGRPSRVLFQQK
jgi:hypothetical protein